MTKNESYRFHMELINEKYPNKSLLNIKDVANIIGVSTKTIRRRIAEGKIAAKKCGNSYSISKVNLVNYMRG